MVHIGRTKGAKISRTEAEPMPNVPAGTVDGIWSKNQPNRTRSNRPNRLSKNTKKLNEIKPNRRSANT